MNTSGPSLRPGSSSGFFSRQLPILLLLAIIALGSYARVMRSGDVPLCMDESWRIACLLDTEDLTNQMLVGMNRTDPILFNLLIYFLGKLYNLEFVLRLASIIPGILTLPLAYLVARKLFSSRWLAVLATFLTAFSPELMVFSKELKPYSLCAFVHLGLLYGYFKYREKINVRTTVVFTALLALSIPMSMHSTFAFPGLFLALLAAAIHTGDRRRVMLVLLSAVIMLLFAGLCFYLLFGIVEDENRLNFMKGYWAGSFPPTDSLGEMISWLYPRYVDHYSDIAFTNRLAPRFIRHYLYLIYFAMAMLGFLTLLLRNRRRFFEAFCLFIMPLLVMVTFSVMNLWPFGRERMNLFVFFYILFPPLYILGEAAGISLKIKGSSRIRKLLPSVGTGGDDRRSLLFSPVAAIIVCTLICVQFPWDFRAFSRSRVRGCGQTSAQALEHVLDIYTDGPQIPVMINHLGQAQFNYYSRYHRNLSERYRKQSHLFDPRRMPTRASGFYLRGAMLRACQESRQVAIYMTHFTGGETMIYNNDFCIEHDWEEGIGSYSCLVTSQIYDAAMKKQQLFSGRRFTGASREWENVYTSPLLDIENAGPDTMVVVNFDLDFHSGDKDLRLVFLDENGSAENFVKNEIYYDRPIKGTHLETAVSVRLNAPVESLRFSISARKKYDFTFTDLSYFTAFDEIREQPAESIRIAENMCERIKLLRRITHVENFTRHHREGLGWTTGTALVEVDGYEIDPAERLFMLETYGWLKPEIREEILNSLEIYFNRNRQAKLMKIEGDIAAKCYFRIPPDVRTVSSIRIKSGTFVPRELGINEDDERSLGIDVKSIGFPDIVRDVDQPNPSPETGGH